MTATFPLPSTGLDATVFPRRRALELDAADSLAAFRSRYLPQTDDVIAYLDGNSLGRPLVSIASAWQDFAQQQWAGRLIRGWSEGWMELPEIVGDELAAAALGARDGQTVIADSTTVNFYKSMRAALNLRPGRRRVVLDRDNFPTNRYVVESLARDLDLELVWLQPATDGGITADDVAAAVDDRTAVVTLSHIAYGSGYLADA
jgi:kynureninase